MLAGPPAAAAPTPQEGGRPQPEGVILPGPDRRDRPHRPRGELEALRHRPAYRLWRLVGHRHPGDADTGWGDTYSQFLPGQSFDITNMSNGTYYIEVVANPDHRLYERSTSNNRSLRKVILGGTRGHRTVTVPPYQGIDAP